MDKEQRLKQLADQLIRAIHKAYSDETIQETLSRIEEEGYQVDILLASFTRLDSQDNEPSEEKENLELFASDYLLYSGPMGEESGSEEDEVRVDPSSLTPEINEFDRTFLRLIKVSCPD
jgi:hypothetical protein